MERGEKHGTVCARCPVLLALFHGFLNIAHPIHPCLPQMFPHGHDQWWQNQMAASPFSPDEAFSKQPLNEFVSLPKNDP